MKVKLDISSEILEDIVIIEAQSMSEQIILNKNQK